MDTTPKKTIQKTKSRSNRAKKSAKRIEKEIKLCQTSTKTMIPPTCMRRVILDAVKGAGNQYRVSAEAQRMIQEEAENMMVGKFFKANRLASLNNRDTVTKEDLKNVAFFET